MIIHQLRFFSRESLEESRMLVLVVDPLVI